MNNLVTMSLATYQAAETLPPFKLTPLWSDGEMVTFKIEEESDNE